MQELAITEYKNIRVLTTQQIAEAYETDADILNRNFNNNRTRYVEGKHFICLKGEELKEAKASGKIYGLQSNANKFYLWTQKGAFLHAKSLNTDVAWDVYDRLVDHYFDSQDKKEIPQKEKDSKLLPLPSVNTMVKNVAKYLEKAGVDDLYIAAEVKRLYTDSGYPINAPLITDKEDMPKLYDCTEMAKELGIMSTKGKPHNQAVNAILAQLEISNDEIVKTAFSRNGHEDVTTQYKPSVFTKVENWLEENFYPVKIPYIDSKGNYKTYSVVYQEVA